MVVTNEKSRALVDRVVKKQVADHQTAWDLDDLLTSMATGEDLTPASHGEEVDDEDEFLTLAQLATSPKPKSPHIMDKQNKTPGSKYKLLNKKHVDSVTKQAHSGQAQKFASPILFAIDGISSRGEAKSSAVIRAEEVRSNLGPEFPSFVKSLVRSHVASCFWMGLPGLFCKRHLPDKDTTVTLEDESGKEYKLKYIAYKTGLSAGWRQFSVDHKLQEGDVLVFQLVEPTKLKVYIVRANDLSELDGALSLLHLDSSTKQKVGDKNNANIDAVAIDSSKRKHVKAVPEVQKKKKTSTPIFASTPILAPNLRQSAEQSENDSDEVHSEVMEGLKLEFKDVRNIKNFSVVIDGISIDAELPKDVRNKYYKLCYSQHAFLHENLIKGMNYKLIVGIISETVSIADDLKLSSLTTSRVDFAKWDKTLQAFQHLGMNVEFLRHRIRRLVSIAYESEGSSETRRYLESRREQSRADYEIKILETKLEELKGACNSFGAYLESLKYKAGAYQLKFQEEVAAPW